MPWIPRCHNTALAAGEVGAILPERIKLRVRAAPCGQVGWSLAPPKRQRGALVLPGNHGTLEEDIESKFRYGFLEA